jgi:alpha-1,3-rhamnosyl/mannosyltransferase
LAASEIFRVQTNRTQLADIARKYHLPRGFVLFNGDVDWNKNLTSLVQACTLINVPLVIYGKSPKQLLDQPDLYNFRHPELSHLPQLRNLLGQSHVYVLGFVPDTDLVTIFNLATVYCQPSFAEGFGIPVLQALACGTPVVCSRTHSLPEVAGDAAVYFDPYNINSVADSLKQVLDNQKLRSALKSRGLIQAGKFSWDKTAADTIRVYQEACQT